VADVILESAITSIIDCEDSVAAVDVEDKLVVYRNWLGLMAGDLSATFAKNGAQFQRRLAEDRIYAAPDGSPLRLSGRSLLLVRNVGLHMESDLILDPQGGETPEGLLDAVFTSLIAMVDLRRSADDRNSRAGSVYIVKPKMHAQRKWCSRCETFARVEQLLGLAR
jgi:malate synthase